MNKKGGLYPNLYVVPGGGIDDGETKLEALAREMREETGLDIASAVIEQVNAATGEGEKTLRDSGETVLVKMNFFDYRIQLSTPAEDTEIFAEDDWEAPRWFTSEQLGRADIGSPTRKTLEKIGFYVQE